nr:hypothetical protein [Tanacetum cinerariifolium]
MDLFAFIHHFDPNKVHIGDHNRAYREIKNDVNQECSVGKDDDVLEEVVALDASEVSAEKAKKKQKRKMTEGVSGFVYPPKKLRDDHQSLPLPTGGKSLSALRGMVPKGSAIPSDATEPLVTASVTLMSDVGPVDYVSGLNLRTRPPHERYVVSSYSSHYSCSYSETDSLVRFVTDVQLRAMDFDQLYSEFNVRAARQVCGGGGYPLFRDAEIAHLRSLLSLKEAEAAEAISLPSQLSVVEAVDAAKGTELRDLKEKNFALEGEKNVLSERVETLESMAASKEVSSLESERDCLATQKNSLEYAFKLFKEQVKKMQDEQVGVLSERVAAIDSDIIEMVFHMDPEFYPRYLTTIAGWRWILSRRAIDKGMQDGLAAGIEHGTVKRSIMDVAAFNPSAESDYIAAINALQGVSFSLLAQLEAKKDASMADIMDLLRLEGPAAETSKASQLQPLLDQLMIPIHRLQDQRDAAARRLSLIDSILPLVEPLSSRNLTSEASSSADFTTVMTVALSTYLVHVALNN